MLHLLQTETEGIVWVLLVRSGFNLVVGSSLTRRQLSRIRQDLKGSLINLSEALSGSGEQTRLLPAVSTADWRGTRLNLINTALQRGRMKGEAESKAADYCQWLRGSVAPGT